jgi:multicomponent Na+:H+ antiporter subunit D
MLSGAVAEARWTVVAVIAASTLLNAGYFLPVVHRAFFRAPGAEDAAHPHGEAPLPIVIALCLTAAGTLALFFAPEVPLGLARAMLEAP